MIKAEVVFDGDVMHLNGYEFYDEYDDINGIYMVRINGEYVEGVDTLEQAVKYCMEQSK